MTPESVDSFARVVRRFVLGAILFNLLLVAQSFCQSVAVVPQGGAGHADKAGCLILKRLGHAEQIASRLYTFDVHGKQFEYVEGKWPEGFPIHGKLTDHDVSILQGLGTEVFVLDSNFTSGELKQARTNCRGVIGNAPTQAEASVQIDVTSNPSGADIEMDGKFVGSTPSSVYVTPAEHTVKLTKSGYLPWERKFTPTSGSVRISPDLQPLSPAKSK